jgi:ATP-dependent DNA helicase RecQ
MKTLQLFRQGRGVEEIARTRGVKESTVFGHLETGLLMGEDLEVRRLIDAQSWKEIATALKRYEGPALSSVFEALGGRYHFGQLRLVRAAESRGR